MPRPPREATAPAGVFVPRRLALGLLALAAAGCASRPPVGEVRVPVEEPVAYTVRAVVEGVDRYEVTVAAEDVTVDSLDFLLPAWTPGQYGTGADRTILENFSASDGNGQPIAARRLGRTVWRLYPVGADYLTVSYTILPDPPDEPLASRTDLSLHAGYAMGAGLLGTLTGLADRPVTVSFDLPRGWRVFAPLDPGGAGRFAASGYGRLAAAPFILGDRIRDYKLFVGGRPHTILVQGGGREFVPDSLLRLVEETVDLGSRFLGVPPYERYLMAVHFRPPEEGGFGAIGQRDASAYFLPVLASRRLRDAGVGTLLLHQYLHAWLPGRFGPVGLVQPDWLSPPPLSDLWFVEGTVEYYARLLPVRYGSADRARFYDTLGVLLTLWRDLGGGPRIDLAEISRAVRGAGDPRAIERMIVGGTLAAFFADLEVRDATGGTRGLEDVLRALERVSPPSGFDGRQTWPLIATELGIPIEALGPLADGGPVSIEVGLSRAGLVVDLQENRARTLGARLVPGPEGRFVVRAVQRGGTAASAGLREGDRLLKINSTPVGPDEVVATNYARDTYIRSASPGSRVTFTVLREGAERELRGTVREIPVTRAVVREARDATEAELVVRSSLFEPGAPTAPSPGR